MKIAKLDQILFNMKIAKLIGKVSQHRETFSSQEEIKDCIFCIKIQSGIDNVGNLERRKIM